jgi:SLT domain-containing protein
LLTQAGQAILKGVTTYFGAGAPAGAGGEYGNFNVDTDIGYAAGGALFAGQRAQVGEEGRELFVSAGRMRLVGVNGPEIIRPTAPGYVLPHAATMALLQTQKSRSASMPLTQRAAGGAVMPGGAYLMGEQGTEAMLSMQQTPWAGQAKGQRPINVTVNVHGVKDAASFVRSGAEVRRAAAMALQDASRSL